MSAILKIYAMLLGMCVLMMVLNGIVQAVVSAFQHPLYMIPACIAIGIGIWIAMIHHNHRILRAK